MEKFSLYKKGVSNITPILDVTIYYIYQLIKSFSLRHITEMIRKGLADKTIDLPGATFSARFSQRRGKNYVSVYAALLCLDYDWDGIIDAATLKEWIRNDVFLNAVLAWISPRGKGLKIVIRVKDGVAEMHGEYFKALALYFKKVFGVELDSTGSDISRLCFLNHDEAVYYNPDGYVTAEALLSLLPKAEDCNTVEKRHCLTFTAAPRYSSTATSIPAFGTSTTTLGERPSDRLNRLPEIHEMAVSALLANGWKQKGELWTRPGKELKNGCSSSYHIYQGIWIFYCFSSNPLVHPFQANKGFNDCQILCLLIYGGDWRSALTDLARRFLS